MIRSMLSTIDNPFNPFDDYAAWYTYDVSSGYHTSSFLARVLNSSDQLSEADELKEIENTIDEVVRENVLGIYVKITKEFPD